MKILLLEALAAASAVTRTPSQPRPVAISWPQPGFQVQRVLLAVGNCNLSVDADGVWLAEQFDEKGDKIAESRMSGDDFVARLFPRQ